MTNSPNAMPGAFNFHQPHRDSGSAPRLSGAKSHIFQPPRTPNASASSSLILTKSTTSIISTSTSIANQGPRGTARKRTLNDYNDSDMRTIPRMTDDWEREGHGDRRWPGAEDYTPGSPKPFVNTRYQLAGGMDTPNLAAENIFEREQEYSDVAYRKTLGATENMKAPEGPRTLFGEIESTDYFALEREANGRGRGFLPPPNTHDWKKGAISVVGAVVGKAWEFCKAGATVFTGFRAGGGQAYKVNDFDSVARFEEVEAEHNWESEKPDWERGEKENTPVPGQFPEEDFIVDYMDNPNDASPSRPSKRRQISGNFRDDDAKTWVIVNQPPSTDSPFRPQPPSQPRSMKNTRIPARRSLAPVSRPASRASFATGSPRHSHLPRVSHAGSPSLQANRGASYASPRSPASKIPRASPMRDVKNIIPAEESPAAREAKKWKAMKRKEEREADESIRRLDAQLKAMIREGKEALGTKIEVELEDNDYDY